MRPFTIIITAAIAATSVAVAVPAPLSNEAQNHDVAPPGVNITEPFGIAADLINHYSSIVKRDNSLDTAGAQTVGLMTFYYNLRWYKDKGFELAGDSDQWLTCMILSNRRTRSIKFTTDLNMQCFAFDRKECNYNNPYWAFYKKVDPGSKGPWGFTDLPKYGWDQRIWAYMCYPLK